MEEHGQAVLTGTHFVHGDWACAEGAIAAGCRFFAAYPITPASEIAERMSQRLPQVGGDFVQFEDELASMAAVVGASYAGVKAMTATSGPGFSLMAENVGLAVMTEAPCVVVDVMRAGPSTGQPTRSGQGDVMQARWFSHGDYELIALAPNSVQEMFDLTVHAFNLAEQYRLPVILLADQVLGHMRERLVIPEPEAIPVVDRKRPTGQPSAYRPFSPDDDLVPPMACFGEGYHFYVTGLTHDERGYPDMSPEAHERLVRRLCDKVRLHAGELTRVETRYLDDADRVVLTFGTPSRPALRAVERARAQGIRAGWARLVTVWPFPEEFVAELAQQVEVILIPEMNTGQLVHPAREAAGGCRVVSLARPSWVPHSSDEILVALQEVRM
jgi:2-oxoglutarate ferredoxin oxidoreductase subunit alpha